MRDKLYFDSVMRFGILPTKFLHIGKGLDTRLLKGLRCKGRSWKAANRYISDIDSEFDGLAPEVSA